MGLLGLVCQQGGFDHMEHEVQPRLRIHVLFVNVRHHTTQGVRLDEHGYRSGVEILTNPPLVLRPFDHSRDRFGESPLRSGKFGGKTGPGV